MLAAEFKLTPNTLKVRARKPDRRTEPVKRGSRFAFEGTDRIEVADADDVLQFFFPRDFAFARGSEDTQPVRRFFYTERGWHYLLAGVPYP